MVCFMIFVHHHPPRPVLPKVSLLVAPTGQAVDWEFILVSHEFATLLSKNAEKITHTLDEQFNFLCVNHLHCTCRKPSIVKRLKNSYSNYAKVGHYWIIGLVTLQLSVIIMIFIVRISSVMSYSCSLSATHSLNYAKA